MNPPAIPSVFEDALAFAERQARRIIAAYPNYYPMYTVGGKWNREGERWTHWCDGFFPGNLWLLHKHTGDTWLREQAERYTRPLEPRKLDRNVHDLGFIFFSTYLRWFHLTGDLALRDVLIQAGRTLALRYQPKGKYLASFIGPQSLFIDIMMNVGLIFWAARETGDEKLYQIAYNHCQTTRHYLVRNDGSTAHEGIFDANTGRFLHQSTHQGWNAESMWARGQAWAIYGFTTAHRLTGEPPFLETAKSCATSYLSRLPRGGFPPGRDMTKVPEEFRDYCRVKLHVPYWDFDLPPEAPHLFDSSAAAIAASGLLDLAEALGPTKGADLRQQALESLATLCGNEFLAKDDPEWEGILKHGVYHFHKNLGVDESVAWGDHFFVEALVKAVHGRSDAAW